MDPDALTSREALEATQHFGIRGGAIAGRRFAISRPDRSACQDGQTDDGIIAQRVDGFRSHVADLCTANGFAILG
jgi:hypothetical protein